MEVSGQLQAPAAVSPEKEPRTPFGQEAGWASEQREEIPFLTLPGIESQSSSP